MWNRETGCPTHCFSLVVCRHPITKKWLAVEELHDRGYWLPGGFVENGDDHESAAIRETIEEAGIEVTLKGILRIENTMTRKGARQRVIYYAEPKKADQQPKNFADNESLGAVWLTIEELKGKRLRGRELLDWAGYIEGGGTIHPLDVFTKEGAMIPSP